MFGKYLTKRRNLEKRRLDGNNGKGDAKIAQFSNALFASRPDNQPNQIPKIKVQNFDFMCY